MPFIPRYATDETPSGMPLAWSLATDQVAAASELRARGGTHLKPDGKSQVTVRYRDGEPVSVDAVVLSWQHEPDRNVDEVRDFLAAHVLEDVIPVERRSPGFRALLNPAGPWTAGGPKSDTGLTGRKIIVDTYGVAEPVSVQPRPLRSMARSGRALLGAPRPGGRAPERAGGRPARHGLDRATRGFGRPVMPHRVWSHECTVDGNGLTHGEPTCDRCGKEGRFEGWSYGMHEDMGRYQTLYRLKPIGLHRPMADELFRDLTVRCARCRGRGLLDHRGRCACCPHCMGLARHFTVPGEVVESEV